MIQSAFSSWNKHRACRFDQNNHSITEHYTVILSKESRSQARPILIILERWTLTFRRPFERTRPVRLKISGIPTNVFSGTGKLVFIIEDIFENVL